MNPTLTVLFYSALAAGCAGLGGLPLAFRERVPVSWIGWANALAAGTMLGAAYALTAADPEGFAAQGAPGSVLGVLFIYWTHAAAGTSELDLNRLDEVDPVYGYKVLLVNALHAGSEGVAIGVAMLVDLSFGILLALAMALHNVAEGLALAAVLRSRGVRLGNAAGLAVAVNLGQVLMAVATFAVVAAAPGALHWALGFAVGALVHLVLVELLPESYRQAGQTSIALMAAAAMGIVVLLTQIRG